MTSDEVPHGVAFKVLERSPSRFHPDCDLFRQRVVQAAQELKAEKRVGEPVIQQAQRAGGSRRFVGRVALSDRSAHKAGPVVQAGVGPPDAGAQIRRPARLVQKVVVGVYEKLMGAEV